MTTHKKSRKAAHAPATQPGSTPPDTPAMNPDAYLGTHGAAKFVGGFPRWLAKLRQEGGGPEYSKPHGGKVLYRIRDLQDWVEKGRRSNTSQDAPTGSGEVE